MKGEGGHTGLTRVSSVRFLIFEIKSVLVFDPIIIYFTDLFMLYIFIQNAYANKKVFNKKSKKLCLMGRIVTESHSFLEYWQNRLIHVGRIVEMINIVNESLWIYEYYINIFI